MKFLESLYYTTVNSEAEIQIISKMLKRDLAQPYPDECYRYFAHKWPELFLLMMKDSGECIGCMISKINYPGVLEQNITTGTSDEDEANDKNGKKRLRGYIAMVSIEPEYRKLGLARHFVQKTIDIMKNKGVTNIIVETEICNKPALNLYHKFGFKIIRCYKEYYDNGNDAYKLQLLID